MTADYSMMFPGQVIFGVDTASELSRNIPDGSKVMLVTGKSAAHNGLLDKMVAILDKFETLTVCGVMPEPDLDEVDRLIKLGRDNGINAVVAVGGGSVMDTAKAAACIIANEGNIRDYFNGSRKIIDRNGVFLAALPTTSGTGAEITPNSVFIDPDSQIKKSIRHRYIIPDLAIVDPVLTVSAPSQITAASGMDALTQAVEAHISKGATSFTDALSARAVELIINSLATACREPDNIQARSDMAEGSMLTALAFSQSGLGAVHGIGHPVGSSLHLAHGLTCAILLVPVLEWNKIVSGDKLTGLAKTCGGKSADDFIDKVRSLRNEIGIPDTFKDAGLKEEHFEFIIKNCRSGSMRVNPRDMSDEDVGSMLKLLS